MFCSVLFYGWSFPCRAGRRSSQNSQGAFLFWQLHESHPCRGPEPSRAAVPCQDTEPGDKPQRSAGAAGGNGRTASPASSVRLYLPAQRHPRQRRRPGGTVLCLQHTARSLRVPAGKSHQASGTGDYSTHHWPYEPRTLLHTHLHTHLHTRVTQKNTFFRCLPCPQ